MLTQDTGKEESVYTVNPKVNVSFNNSRLSKEDRDILCYSVHGGVAGSCFFGQPFLLSHIYIDMCYTGQYYLKAIILLSPTAVDLWIHKRSQNVIRNSSFGTKQKGISFMINTLHFRDLTPQRDHEN